MKLRDWLCINEISLGDFAKSLDHAYAHIGGISRGTVKAGKLLAIAIEMQTKGAVTREEVIAHYKGKKEKKHGRRDHKV